MTVFFSKRRILVLIFLLLFFFIVVKYLWLSKHFIVPPSNWITLGSLTDELVKIGFKTDYNLSKLILLWTPFFSQHNYLRSVGELGCPNERCTFTSDRRKILESHAVVFHLRDLDINDLPKQRLLHQRWVLLHHESPIHTPNNLRQLDGFFNWTITYRLNSDVLLTPLPRLKKSGQEPEAVTDYTSNKSRMAFWFVSNCETAGNREGFVKELQKTIPVEIIGKCSSKTCQPKMSEKCYRDYARDYYFYLSFENSICKDYVTEKLYHMFDYPVVPVVFGGADYGKFAPPRSVINALSFKSPKSLGKFLLKLAKDRDQYNSYFNWKSRYQVVHNYSHYACELCRKLNDLNEPVKVWTNLHNWWFTESKCRRWPQLT